SVAYTRLCVITLSVIVTVAPVTPGWLGMGFLAGVMMTPPPCTTGGSGNELLTPSLIVTPLMDTVAGVVGHGNGAPTSTTGEPPEIVVCFAPAPTMLTLTLIWMPPA